MRKPWTETELIRRLQALRPNYLYIDSYDEVELIDQLIQRLKKEEKVVDKDIENKQEMRALIQNVFLASAVTIVGHVIMHWVWK